MNMKQKCLGDVFCVSANAVVFPCVYSLLTVTYILIINVYECFAYTNISAMCVPSAFGG